MHRCYYSLGLISYSCNCGAAYLKPSVTYSPRRLNQETIAKPTHFVQYLSGNYTLHLLQVDLIAK